LYTETTKTESHIVVLVCQPSCNLTTFYEICHIYASEVDPKAALVPNRGLGDFLLYTYHHAGLVSKPGGAGEIRCGLNIIGLVLLCVHQCSSVGIIP
jgi:hypothetical protein